MQDLPDRLTVRFSVRGAGLVCALIDSELGVISTSGFDHGEDFVSGGVARKREFGLWLLDSSALLDSGELADHIDAIQTKLRGRADRIHAVAQNHPDYDVRLTITVRTEELATGFDISSATLGEIADLGCEVTVRFISRAPSQ